jgi:hypothetical protein
MQTARNDFLTFLQKGQSITANEARSMFGVNNIADMVYRLRNEGYAVYTNRTESNGFEYRLGSPSDKFKRQMATRHKARARRALYSEALSAN